MDGKKVYAEEVKAYPSPKLSTAKRKLEAFVILAISNIEPLKIGLVFAKRLSLSIGDIS